MFRRVLAHAIHNGEGGDDHFAGGERAENANADLPVEAQGGNDGFNGVANFSGKRILQRMLRGQVIGLVIQFIGFGGITRFLKLSSLHG